MLYPPIWNFSPRRSSLLINRHWFINGEKSITFSILGIGIHSIDREGGERRRKKKWNEMKTIWPSEYCAMTSWLLQRNSLLANFQFLLWTIYSKMSQPTYQFDWFRFDINRKHNKLRCNFLWRERSRKEKWMPYLAELLSWRQLFEWMTRKTFRARKQYNLWTHCFIWRRSSFDRWRLNLRGLLFFESEHLCKVSFWSQFSLFSQINFQRVYFHHSVFEHEFLYFHGIFSLSQ